MTHKILFAALFMLCGIATCIVPFIAAAQSPTPTNAEEPLEITADGFLEWDRNNQVFTAKTNAKAKQGTVSIAADMLKADYRDGQKSRAMEIYEMSAKGNVIIESQDSEARGDAATYVLDSGLATMTGENLQLISADQTVTAEDKFEYFVQDGKLIATGNATVFRPNIETGFTDTLKAQKLTALMSEDAQGKRVLKSLLADNNIVITTATETISGQNGIYNADTNIATIRGNVTIARGPNTLEGERAEVNLTTNVSKIFGGAGSNKQIKGVFYPGSEQKTTP